MLALIFFKNKMVVNQIKQMRRATMACVVRRFRCSYRAEEATGVLPAQLDLNGKIAQ